MPTNTTPKATAIGQAVAKTLDYAVYYLVEIILIVLILYVCISRGLTFSIDIYDPLEPAAGKVLSEASVSGDWLRGVGKSATALLAAFTAPAPPPGKPTAALTETTVAIDAAHPGFNEVAPSSDPAPHLSNLTLVLSPDYGKRKNLPAHIIAAKKQRVQNYLQQYAEIAQQEMAAYGIPASITLAQGLLESVKAINFSFNSTSESELSKS